MPQIQFQPHALDQLKERGLTEEVAKITIDEPDEVVTTGIRQIAQKIVTMNGKQYLVRVIYEQSDDLISVVTVYRTSKIAKYRTRR